MKKEIKDYLHLYLGCQVVYKDGDETGIFRGTLVGVTESEVEPGQIIAIVKAGGHVFTEWDIEKTQPVLRKLSSISLGEYSELAVRKKFEGSNGVGYTSFIGVARYQSTNVFFPTSDVKFLLSRYFDLFDLIPEGLASEWVG